MFGSESERTQALLTYGDMSRIGNMPIQIPPEVEVILGTHNIELSGPKGSLKMKLRPEIKIEQNKGQLILSGKREDKLTKSLHGLYRASISNMVKGITGGWNRKLEMVGVGYRASTDGESLTLQVGFSHSVVIKAPEGITFGVEENTKISVSGIDKILVGQVAANIRKIKPPEVYKGKGIRFLGEKVRKKPGKAGKAIVGGTK